MGYLRPNPAQKASVSAQRGFYGLYLGSETQAISMKVQSDAFDDIGNT